MQVSQLWRYPVKSLQGERLDSVALDSEGLDGDRRWAIFDATTGYGLTARRFPALLFAAARRRPDGTPEITLPDGTVAGDDDLSTWLGRRVSLRSTSQVVDRRYENPSDFEHEATAGWAPFDGAHGAFHDSEGAKLSIVSTATLGDWEPRRFRANVIVDGAGEDDLVGHRVGVGAALVDVGLRIERCVMVTRPQPEGVEKDLDVLRAIHRLRGSRLAVGATVTRPGQVSVGDVVAPA